jgi:two-component system, sensor histidine kinase and response regulator
MFEDYSARRSPQEELRQQLDQERVFTQLATQIRQTQELPLILDNAVELVCTSLQADRAVLYQFEAPDATEPRPFQQQPKAPKALLNSTIAAPIICGHVAHEFRLNSTIPCILNLSEGAECFVGVKNYKEKYRKGTVQVVDDITTTYAAAPCLVQLLEQAQVRAKLVVPIVVGDGLWGLLIVHQCLGVRQWQDSETRFLRVIVELLAIAIHQTNLYQQLTQQAQTLEQQVVERTQELHDALNSSQSASLSKTEFLAAVSHELRTPLTVIIGMATTLLRLPNHTNQERRISIEKQQNYLEIIRNSGSHLLGLINDILDLSQVEAGRAVLECCEFSLVQVLTECVRVLTDKAQQRAIKLQVDFQFEKHSGVLINQDDRFIADSRRIQQIVLNLLGNAIKFTPEEGTVTLRVWKENNQAFIQVEDTGIGIPNHQFPLLFKKFQQLDPTYHRQYEGSGLGLALSKQLVELHGGGIEVESTVNVGSIFTVRIPAQSITSQNPALLTPTNAIPSPTSLAIARIMLVENHEPTATVISNLLITAGHQVIWMMDGLTALRQVELIKPTIALVNAHLNGISISEIVHQLRHNPQTQRVKIVILVDENHSHQCDRWLAEGVHACLIQPSNHPEELLNTVAALIAEMRS